MRSLLRACVGFGVLCCTVPARAAVVYDSLPGAGVRNTDSLVYGASGTSEFGDAVALAGTARYLTRVTVSFSSAALAANYPGTGSASGYTVPMTLTLYGLGTPGPDPAVGAAFASVSRSAVLPWRPAASAGCTGGDYKASDGYCYSGVASVVTFDFTNVLAPNSLILGLRFAGTGGPSEFLGFGLTRGTNVGTDLDADGVEWNTADASFRTIGAAGVFGPDTGWSEYGTPAFRIEAETTPVPEPATFVLLGAAIPLAAALRRGCRPPPPRRAGHA